MKARDYITKQQWRDILAGHACFLRRTARLFQSPALAEPDLAGHRSIEFHTDCLSFHLIYSHQNGTVLTVNIHPEINGGTNPVLETTGADFRPIQERIQQWQSRFRLLKQTATLDFRQTALIRALLYGFQPLRKGSSLCPAARPPLQSGNQAAAGLRSLGTP